MPLRALKVSSHEEMLAENLSEENRRDNYECPYCRAKFITILPVEGIVKHFRHPSGVVDHFNEPESETHLNMKQQISDIAKRFGYRPSLEVEIGNHIADVVIER